MDQDKKFANLFMEYLDGAMEQYKDAMANAEEMLGSAFAEENFFGSAKEQFYDDVVEHLIYLASTEDSPSMRECLVIGECLGVTHSEASDIIKTAKCNTEKKLNYEETIPSSVAALVEASEKMDAYLAEVTPEKEAVPFASTVVNVLAEIGKMFLRINGDAPAEKRERHEKFIRMLQRSVNRG